jgi:hypothetical protein
MIWMFLAGALTAWLVISTLFWLALEGNSRFAFLWPLAFVKELVRSLMRRQAQ